MDWKVFATFLAPLITAFIAFILNKFFQNKPKLIAYYGHISVHKVTPPDSGSLNIHTHAVVVRNTGKLPAKNVRVGHNFLPDYNVMPSTMYEVLKIPGGGEEISFPILVPNEQITISYLYFPPITYSQINTYVKSDEGLAKVINVIPTPSLSPAQKFLAYILLFIGCSTVIYLLIIIVVALLRCLN